MTASRRWNILLILIAIFGVLGSICLLYVLSKAIAIWALFGALAEGSQPIAAPAEFPETDIIYASGSASELGFLNADGSGQVSFPFQAPLKTILSEWGAPMLTGDRQTLIVRDHAYEYPMGTVLIAHPGEIAKACWDGIPQLASDQRHIYIGDDHGISKYALEDCGTDNAPEKVFHGIHGALSPDEQYIAVTRAGEPPAQYQNPIYSVVIRHLPTGTERIIGPGDLPSWSHDGQWLAYAGLDGLYIVQNSPDAQPRRLVALDSPAPSISAPVYQYRREVLYVPPIAFWSPDDRWLVYQAFNPAHSHPIFKVNVETGETVKLLDNGTFPYWVSPMEEP